MDNKQFEEEFFKLYQKGLSTTEICEILQEKRDKGYKLLKKFHKKSNITPRVVSENDIEILIQKYKEGKTIQELSELFPHMKKGTINYWLKQKKVTRPNGRKANCNEFYFKNIDTPQKAYFLGLLFADGCIVKNKNKGKNSYTISLELKIEDKYIIEKFAEEIESSLKVKEMEKQMYYNVKGKEYNFVKHTAYFRINSCAMAKDLMNWGCNLNKTNDLNGIPDIQDNLKKYFLLGFFDGDGIVSHGKLSYMGFCGTEKMMQSIKDFIENNLKISKNIYYNRSNKIYYLQYYLTTGMKELYEFLYYNTDNLYCLKRKKEKTENILKEKKLI